LKIKCPTRLAHPTRLTQKSIAERKAPIKPPTQKQSMSKKTKTAVAEAAVEPIVANGIEFTPKMIEDLTKIAEIEAPGGAASPLPDSPPHGQRGRCPSRVAKSLREAPCRLPCLRF
jgi:hypothetical protein